MIHTQTIMNNQNRVCTGKCIKFKAKKPSIGGRYEAGQYRCQICDIYLVHQGVDGNSCRCCNYRVRTKPRNSLYKEKFHNRVQNTQDRLISTNKISDIVKSTKKKISFFSEDGKKSTPIYEEIDKSMKTYYEFKEFLESKIKPQANYQFVMLKELLEYGKLHKGDIAESLAYFNNKDTTDLETVKSYLNVPVYDVLLKHALVTSKGEYYGLSYFTLNVKLTKFQRIELIDYFINAIVIYNKEHGILENEFPNSNNTDNIEWSDINSKIVKECPKCHETKIGGFPGIEFDDKIEKFFGYRQLDPTDSQSRTPQSYCRKCRSSQHREDV